MAIRRELYRIGKVGDDAGTGRIMAVKLEPLEAFFFNLRNWLFLPQPYGNVFLYTEAEAQAFNESD